MPFVYNTGILEQLYFEVSFLPPCIFSTTSCPDARAPNKKILNPSDEKKKKEFY